MTEKDKQLIETIKSKENHIGRLKEHLCRVDVDKVMQEIVTLYSFDKDSPAKAIPEEVAGAFFEYTSKLAEQYPNWCPLGYMQHSNNARILGKLAKYNPKAHEDFLRTSLLAINPDFQRLVIADINEIYKDNPQKAVEDIYLKAYENPKISPKAKAQLGVNLFAILTSEKNANVLNNVLNTRPELFGEILQAATTKGWEPLYTLRNLQNPAVSQWINKNPKAYEGAVVNGIYTHCCITNGGKATHQRMAEYGRIVGMIDEKFLQDNPKFSERLNAIAGNDRTFDEEMKKLFDAHSHKSQFSKGNDAHSR